MGSGEETPAVFARAEMCSAAGSVRGRQEGREAVRETGSCFLKYLFRQSSGLPSAETEMELNWVFFPPAIGSISGPVSSGWDLKALVIETGSPWGSGCCWNMMHGEPLGHPMLRRRVFRGADAGHTRGGGLVPDWSRNKGAQRKSLKMTQTTAEMSG